MDERLAGAVPVAHGPHTLEGPTAHAGGVLVSGERGRRTIGHRGPLGDGAGLLRTFDGDLVRTVQRDTNTSPDIVDDACAFAWQQFMRDQPDRERMVAGRPDS